MHASIHGHRGSVDDLIYLVGRVVALDLRGAENGVATKLHSDTGGDHAPQ